jgi:predicted secreted protein
MKMKQAIMLILVLLLTVLPGISCFVTSRDIHVVITCDDFTENPASMRNDFEIEVGDKVYTELCSNPSTGFQWLYEMSGDPAVKEEDHDFQEPENSIPGAPGKETWTFEGVKKGTAVITMEYSQSWEGGIKNEWTYIMTVTVK